MELKDLVKNEVKFLQEQETPFNEHGACIFISQDTHMQVDLQYFLLEYKNWLVERKLVQPYKNEFNIANVTSSILPRLSQKSINEMIDNIKVNKGNLYYIAETGTINGSLREEIRKAISLFALQEIIEALKLFGIEDPST